MTTRRCRASSSRVTWSCQMSMPITFSGPIAVRIVLPSAREALAGREIGIVLVGQAAHQAAAGAGDLRRIERKVLVLRELQRDRLDLAQPGGAAELAAAAADPTQEGRFIANADLSQLDARPERPSRGPGRAAGSRPCARP